MHWWWHHCQHASIDVESHQCNKLLIPVQSNSIMYCRYSSVSCTVGLIFCDCFHASSEPLLLSAVFVGLAVAATGIGMSTAQTWARRRCNSTADCCYYCHDGSGVSCNNAIVSFGRVCIGRVRPCVLCRPLGYWNCSLVFLSRYN